MMPAANRLSENDRGKRPGLLKRQSTRRRVVLSQMNGGVAWRKPAFSEWIEFREFCYAGLG